MNEKNIDIEFKKGIISIESYRALLDAEIYGTATPMQWLIARLNVLKGVVKSGVRVKFETDSEEGYISSEREYIEWCEENFPSAYRFVK